MKKVKFKILFVVLSLLLVLPATAVADQTQDIGTPRWVIDDVFISDIVPFAIGHRGSGVNLGNIPDKPIENTTKAVRQAFREGIQIVEVDANLTADGVAVALHDDFFLSDFTCVNSYTYEQLKERLSDVSSLRQILKVSRTYSVMSDSDRPSGQVVVEIKTPSPHCVSREAEPFVLQALVETVLDDIRFTRMVDQVTIESFSPEILALAAVGEPNIPRMLAIDAMQLLPLESIQELPGYVVEIIEDKDLYGLTWGEIGVETPYGILWVYRLPGYYTENPGGPFVNYIMTLLGTGSSTASLDKNILFLAEELGLSASFIVDALHFGLPELPPFSFSVLVFTVDFGDPEDLDYPDYGEWLLLSGAGVDGMYVDDIPVGLTIEGY
jgi:glycerophosphoryl diester phosphodiesterase